MQSSLIGKIEKARIYAKERHRTTINQLRCRVEGDNATHTVTLGSESWHCDCLFFADYGTCSHAMAIQRILEEVLPASLRLTHTAA